MSKGYGVFGHVPANADDTISLMNTLEPQQTEEEVHALVRHLLSLHLTPANTRLHVPTLPHSTPYAPEWRGLHSTTAT